jgi:hypothetical protein
MGGRFDWQGVGRGVGEVGAELAAHREETLVRREREEERRRIEEERKRREEERRLQLRLQGAEVALQAARAAAKSPDDPHLQSALRKYEEAMAALTGAQFRLPRRVIGARPGRPPRPAEQQFVPGLDAKMEIPADPGEPEVPGVEIIEPGPLNRPPVTFRAFAGSVGVALTPEQDAQFGDRPWDEVMQMNAAARQAGRPLFPQFTEGDERQLAAVREEAHQHQVQIVNARTPAARAAAVDAGQRFKRFVLQRHPTLAPLLPDFAAIGAQMDRELQEATKREVLTQQYDTWREGLKQAQARYQKAFRGIDATELVMALTELNHYVSAGLKNEWLTGRKPLDQNTVIRTWKQARERDFRRAGLEDRRLALDVAAAQRRLQEAGAAAAEGQVHRHRPLFEGRPGRYIIVTRYGRDGGIMAQHVVDARTGKVVRDSLLAQRAAQGDREAEAILGVRPTPAAAPDPVAAQRARPVRDLTIAELREEAAHIGQELLDQPEPARARTLRARLMEVEAQIRRSEEAAREMELGRAAMRPPAAPPREVTDPDQRRRLILNPPSAEAARVFHIWNQTRRPVPPAVWQHLTEQERRWLQSLGVVTRQ